MATIARTLLDKIGALPDERIAELEDYVDFLHGREQGRAFQHAPAGPHPAGFAEARTGPDYYAGESRIGRDSQVMMGKPVVAGTRITVEHILRLLGAGDTTADIVRNHPQLTEADIRAAQAYAGDCLAHGHVSAAG
jgi:uncharacterized protein (DUF433 family)